jgi:hypothetical protein
VIQFNSTLSLLIFCLLDLSITERGVKVSKMCHLIWICLIFEIFFHDLKLQWSQHLVYKIYPLQNLIYYISMRIPLFFTWGIFAIISWFSFLLPYFYSGVENSGSILHILIPWLCVVFSTIGRLLSPNFNVFICCSYFPGNTLNFYFNKFSLSTSSNGIFASKSFFHMCNKHLYIAYFFPYLSFLIFNKSRLQIAQYLYISFSFFYFFGSTSTGVWIQGFTLARQVL